MSRCAACDQDLPRAARFCPACGSAVRHEASPVASLLERRHLTVMFCDVVGSTGLSQVLDPEALHDVMRSYQTTCASEVAHHDGYVAQYLGDGILAFFGYPRAHEDDAARAVRAGLGVLERLHRLNEQVARAHGVHLSIRIAVHSGLIVLDARGPGPEEASALGHPMNVAARLQEAAEPDTLVVSDETRRLIEGRFVMKEVGQHRFRGLDYALRVHRVMQETGREERLDRIEGGGLTPFVGRQEECAILRDLWERARSGTGQVALVRGEPGMGKSRLLRQLRGELRDGSVVWAEARCSAYHEHSAFYPVIHLIEESFEVGRGETPSFEQVEESFRLSGLDLPQNVPIVAELLSLPVPNRYEPLSLTAEIKRERTFEVLLNWVLATARVQPAVFVMEDLHWADASSKRLLRMLAERTHEVPLLLLLTARPEYEPDWTPFEHETRLELQALERPHAEEMITCIAKGRVVPPETLKDLFRKTDGVPLFLEELTRATLESGLIGETASPGVPGARIPTTLQDSLMARLDRLGPARGVAQLASVIGREFTREMLQAIHPGESGSLDHLLAQLISEGIVVEGTDSGDPEYAFRHSLIRDAAYESMLRRNRRGLHKRIAQTLLQRYPESVDNEPEILARHFQAAGLFDEALFYLNRAGERAMGRCAYEEALHHLEQGLAVLPQLEPAGERAHHELALRVTLGTVYFTTQGFGSEAVHSTFDRARAIHDDLGEEITKEVLHGLWTYALVRCEDERAAALLPDFERLAQRTGDPVAALTGHSILGVYAFCTARYESARRHFELALPYHDTPEFERWAREYGYDGALHSYGYCASALWALGYPQRAVALCAELDAAAERRRTPHFESAALMWRASLARNRGEVELARRISSQLLGLAAEQRMPVAMALASVMLGWATAESGDPETGIQQIQGGIRLYDMAGISSSSYLYHGALAEAQLLASRVEEGLVSAERALTACLEHPLMRYNLPSALRIQATLLRRKSLPGAEQNLRRAIEEARSTGAVSFELEAALDLARMRLEDGKPGDAGDILAHVYGRFDEGHDTRPLQQAAELLGQLS